MVDQHWLKFMREQYPQGSRIRLREMKDPNAPIEPGAMGTLEHIDDAGNFFCAWDSGCRLGLAMGVDSFTVLPPETHTLKLYMPMSVTYYERNQWGDMDDTELNLDDGEMVREADHIIAALQREALPTESERGLMHYYHENDSVNDKVKSCVFTAEVRDKKLWGVAVCQVIGELNPAELDTLKEYVSGQASDGLGEGFEQRPIKMSNGNEMYAHLWQWDHWCVQTAAEMGMEEQNYKMEFGGM